MKSEFASMEKEKKPTTRREVLEKKKAIEGLIKAASSVKDPLAAFPSLLRFDNDGVSVCFKSGRGNHLSISTKLYVQNLLKLNMAKHYGLEWPTQEKVKRTEMVASDAHYIFIHELTKRKNAEENNLLPMVGFVHYRFVIEEELPVLYVYELQLESHMQGKGLGNFLMELLENIANKNCMDAIMLTVQKANSCALSFYQRKLRYTVSATSPSRVHPSMTDWSYEILCKALKEEARVKLCA